VPCICCNTTLWNINVRKQAINDKLQGSIATVPSVLWRCWLGGRQGIRPVKNWVVRCWCGYLSGARCRLAHPQLMPLPLTISCSSKIQIDFTFLVPAHPGSPGQRAVKRVCVCVCSIATYLRYGGVVNNQIKKGLLLSLKLKMFLNRWIFGMGLYRALSSSFSSQLARRTKYMRQPCIVTYSPILIFFTDRLY